jgi:hypothetical protein
MASMAHNQTTTIDDRIVFPSALYLPDPSAKCVWGTEKAVTPQETLERPRCGVDVHRVGHGITPFVMKVRGGEIRIRSRLDLLPVLQPTTQKREI